MSASDRPSGFVRKHLGIAFGAAAIAIGSSLATMAINVGSRFADRTVGSIVTTEQLQRELGKLREGFRAELGERPDVGRRALYQRIAELEAENLGLREQLGQEIGLRTALQVGAFARLDPRERLAVGKDLANAWARYRTEALSLKDPWQASGNVLSASQTPRSD